MSFRQKKYGWEFLQNLHANGWAQDRCSVIVIDPELEIWLWQDNANVAQAIGFTGPSLRQHLQQVGKWPVGAAKPLDPKKTIQRFITGHKGLNTKVIYSRIARSVSVAGCTDLAFQSFAGTLRGWFPQGAGA